MSERPPADTLDPSAMWAHDALCDASDLRCPLPVLHARKRLLAMAPRQRLLLVANDPMSSIDVPHFCGESGHRLIRSDHRGETRRFLIERV